DYCTSTTLSLSCVPVSRPESTVPDIPPLSLHDALPILISILPFSPIAFAMATGVGSGVMTAAALGPLVEMYPDQAAAVITPLPRSEEHTSELQSRFDIVCRLLLEKNNVPSSSRVISRLT